MSLEKRLIGSSAVLSADGNVTDVDVSGLVRRLILFDKYILDSVRLKEFPLLIKYLKYEGLRDLLSSDLIEIRCECLQLGQVGQSGLFGDPILPLLTYKFNWIDTHDKEEYVHDCLQGMHDVPGLKHKDVLRLKKQIVDCITPLPSQIKEELWPNFQFELNNEALLKKSTQMVLQKRFGKFDESVSVKLHQETKDEYKVETNISEYTNLSVEETHKIIEAALLGVAGLSQTIGEMKAYSALSGFRDEDLPLFRSKLDLLADLASSENKERRFQRIFDIAGTPNFQPSDGSVSIDKLLKLRNSAETREFRDWLTSCGAATDDEIKEQVSSFRAHAGLIMSSGIGKSMRFLITSGIGFASIPDIQAISLGLGFFDGFVLDKILPRSGIAAFVNDLYPSIFQKAIK